MDSKLSQAGYDLALEIRVANGVTSRTFGPSLHQHPMNCSTSFAGVFQGKQINNMLKLWQTASSTHGSLPNISFKADGVV